jgi:hypothetical protein
MISKEYYIENKQIKDRYAITFIYKLQASVG